MVDNSWISKPIQWATDIGKNVINFGSDALEWASDAFLGTNLHGDKVNQGIANQNIAFQKQENEITRAREDNAVQRAAADMTAAGLSKTLSAGNPASAQSLTAPNNSYRYSAAIDKMNLYERMKSLYYQDRADKRSEELNNAQVESAKAEAALKYSQASGQNLSNGVYLDRYSNEMRLMGSQTALNQQNRLLSSANTKLAEIEGSNRQRAIDASIKKDIEQAFLFGEQSRTQATSRLKYISDIHLNEKNMKYVDSQISKISQDIAESKAREFKLGYEAELLVEDISKIRLEQAIDWYNFEFSKDKKIRTTDPMSKLWGFNVDNLWDKGSSALKDAWHDVWRPIWKWSIFQND